MIVQNELRILAEKLDFIKDNENQLDRKEIWEIKNSVELKLIEILEDGKICE